MCFTRIKFYSKFAFINSERKTKSFKITHEQGYGGLLLNVRSVFFVCHSVHTGLRHYWRPLPVLRGSWIFGSYWEVLDEWDRRRPPCSDNHNDVLMQQWLFPWLVLNILYLWIIEYSIFTILQAKRHDYLHFINESHETLILERLKANFAFNFLMELF